MVLWSKFGEHMLYGCRDMNWPHIFSRGTLTVKSGVKKQLSGSKSYRYMPKVP